VIIIRNKKLLLGLSVFFIAFLFTGCYLFNSSPVIESDPVTTAKEGAVYTYDVEATDPNGDTLTYSLPINPTGMTINSTTGVITWTPTEDQIGENVVVVEVSDGSKSTTQSFSVTVDETLLASIEVFPSSMTLEIGESKTITSVTAHYDNGTEANITPLTTCTYESDKPGTATVSPSGTIKGIATCTASTAAIITVSYTEDTTTKADTVSVVVTNPSPG
jgi:hypothetical protein